MALLSDNFDAIFFAHGRDVLISDFAKRFGIFFK